MSDDMKHIILADMNKTRWFAVYCGHANINVKLYSWPLKFHKVVWQQIWGEVVILIPFSADPFWI